MRRLGIVAGRGELPVALAQAIARGGVEPCVVRVCKTTRPACGVNLGTFCLGQIEGMARAFRAAGVSEILFAGSVGWPRPWEVRFDVGAIVPLLVALTGRGDRILRAAARAFASRGIEVGDPRPWLADLIAPAGHIAGPAPCASLAKSFEIGLRGAKLTGNRQGGQAAIVYRGKLCDLENRVGTDALISRAPGPGAVLVKAAAPHQDLRFDLPTIGPTTVRLAAAVGLQSIAVEAGTCLILERLEVERLCDKHGVGLGGFLPLGNNTNISWHVPVR